MCANEIPEYKLQDTFINSKRRLELKKLINNGDIVKKSDGYYTKEYKYSLYKDEQQATKAGTFARSSTAYVSGKNDVSKTQTLVQNGNSNLIVPDNEIRIIGLDVEKQSANKPQTQKNVI